MNLKTVYLLVPVKGNSFKDGMAIGQIRLHVGRGQKLLDARIAFERELNGGRTWDELLNSCKSSEELAAFTVNSWQVHSDTWQSWNNYRGSESWPIQREVEALDQ